jgi:3-phosphoshikimate 1-carboxyvinyltransferase
MRRVTEPLTLMGARFAVKDSDRLPVTIRGGPLRSIEWELPVSSAQIKGCLLFAGVAAKCAVSLREPFGRSRDHTERLLRSFGYSVIEDSTGWIRSQPNGELEPFDLIVPGDPSSAVFLIGAALLAERGELRIQRVGQNPTRTGFLRILERMGAWVESTARGITGGEPVGDLFVAASELQGTVVTPSEVVGVIDEIPMLAVLASRAKGESRFLEVGELRVKESDRLSLLAANLRAIGAKAAVEGNNLIVEGGARPPRGRIKTESDHRIAMAFEVLNAVKGARVQVDNLECSAVSFPGFPETLRSILRKGASR